VTSFDEKRDFKSKVKALSLKLQKLKGKIKYNALKIKVVRQILYIHFYDSFLSRRYFECFRILYR